MQTQTTQDWPSSAWPFPTTMPGTQNLTDLEKAIEQFLDTKNAFETVIVEGAMKRYRLDLMTAATNNGIGIVHIFEAGEKGGLTVAFKKSTGFKSGRMVQVAVATCSIEDHFNKKIGVRVAIEKFFDGETIELPLLKDYCLDHLSFAVKAAFTALYRAV